MATIDEIKQQAEAVKNATQVGENTAERVGGALAGLADIAKAQEDNIGKKADKAAMDVELGKKADKEEMNRLLATKANTADVDTKFTEEKKRVDAELEKKANDEEVKRSFLEQTAKNTAQDAEIAKKANSEDVTSQMQTEQTRVNDELAKKFNKEDIAQDFGDSKDKVVSQHALPFRYIQNEEFIFAMVDANDVFLAGIRWNGTPKYAKIEENTNRDIESINAQIKYIHEQISDARKDLKRNVLSLSFDRSTGRIIGTTSDTSRITSCTQDRTTGKIIMNHQLD